VAFGWLGSFLLQSGRRVVSSVRFGGARCRLLAWSPLLSEATAVQPGACLSQLLRYSSSVVAQIGLSVYDDDDDDEEAKPTISLEGRTYFCAVGGHTPCARRPSQQTMSLDTLLSHMLHD